MKQMYYVVAIKELSSGTIERTITPYESEDTALRKFHETFNVIGGGPKRITAILLKDVRWQVMNTVNQQSVITEEDIINSFNVDVVKNESWVAQETDTTTES